MNLKVGTGHTPKHTLVALLVPTTPATPKPPPAYPPPCAGSARVGGEVTIDAGDSSHPSGIGGSVSITAGTGTSVSTTGKFSSMYCVHHTSTHHTYLTDRSTSCRLLQMAAMAASYIFTAATLLDSLRMTSAVAWILSEAQRQLGPAARSRSRVELARPHPVAV